jgi:UDP-glucose 4-epimerase
MNILVTGGAGYIGSFMVKKLLDGGDNVFIADSLERGDKKKIDKRAGFKQGNLLDREFTDLLFKENKFDAVMHFAAYISVEESMRSPEKYFENNVFSTVNILNAMQKSNVKHFIFSSTGTVYGSPKILPTPETHELRPENPYAESKLMVEKVLHWYHKAFGIGYAVLRYFNAAGGALDGSLGESHDPETHLIPNAINAALKHREFYLFGNDYETRDGTAIRDYIHVLDLIQAHLVTLKKLQEENGEYVFNVGTGRGSTNKEVLEMVKKISGINFPVVIKERRSGDVAETVADPTKIKNELGFEPKHSDLETIIKTAWQWHAKKI